jgi:hypothetical protein
MSSNFALLNKHTTAPSFRVGNILIMLKIKIIFMALRAANFEKKRKIIKK